MKIILGSESKDKEKILTNSFSELNLNVEIEGVKVDSEIDSQPLDKEVTRSGAVNRAKNARKLKPSADFWVGLEGGLHDYGEGYHLVTYAYLLDKEGDGFEGKGEEIHLPLEVSKRVRNGEWFGDVIREYAKNNEIDNNLITRLSPFTNAVQNAYANYLKAKGGLEYRQKANAIILDKTDRVLLVQLNDYGEDQWNTPGGGLEDGETAKEAIFRELKEELGTNKFEMLNESKIKDKYDFPDFVIAKGLKKGKKYIGQEQNQFVLRFVGGDSDIKTQEEEIKKYKWVDYEELESHLIFPNQWENVRDVIEEWNSAN